MCFLCAGPPVWTPLCLALWLRFTKPVCPAALCSDTSNSWITSRAFVTTSSPYTSAPIAPVSRLHPREIFPPFPTRVWVTSSSSSRLLIFVHLISALWTCSLITRCSCLFSSGLPSTSVSRFSTICPRNQGCQPPKINTACK